MEDALVKEVALEVRHQAVTSLKMFSIEGLRYIVLPSEAVYNASVEAAKERLAAKRAPTPPPDSIDAVLAEMYRAVG